MRREAQAQYPPQQNHRQSYGDNRDTNTTQVSWRTAAQHRIYRTNPGVVLVASRFAAAPTPSLGGGVFWEACRGPQAVLPAKNVHTQYVNRRTTAKALDLYPHFE